MRVERRFGLRERICELEGGVQALERDELTLFDFARNHTGSHKINNAIGQV